MKALGRGIRKFLCQHLGVECSDEALPVLPAAERQELEKFQRHTQSAKRLTEQLRLELISLDAEADLIVQAANAANASEEGPYAA